ncbi:MAG: hypothetical protein G01um101413_802 [Parcubacteria group bacterium Gr01-1014_13]|nr:MAG: hypothetical protein G01um101413_802 [Parcubacteria group bacterium Gr01-1014_13]
MLIALILVSVYAYALTGYCVQKAEYCEALDDKLIFGVLWPFWVVVYIYRFMRISMNKAKMASRKRKEEPATILADQ